MASYSDITTLVTGGGTITFNATTGNTYLIDPAASSGLDGVELRKQIDKRAQTDGLIAHDGFEDGLHLVLAGVIVADTVTNRNSMISALKTALRSIASTTGTLNFGSTPSITVEWELGVEFPVWRGHVRGFRFGLLATTAP
jgi:spore coat protein U-like protein